MGLPKGPMEDGTRQLPVAENTENPGQSAR